MALYKRGRVYHYASGSTVDVIGDLRRKPHSPPLEESRHSQWPEPKNEEAFFH